MFAIAFDLCIQDLQNAHPKGKKEFQMPTGKLAQFWQNGVSNFEWVQGSVYITDEDSMANLFSAIQDLKSLPWFPASVRDIRAFRIENWSDFTDIVKS